MNDFNNAHMLGTAEMRRNEMNYRRGAGRRYQALQAAANGNLAPMEAYQREVEAVALSAARTATKERTMDDFQELVLTRLTSIAESLAQMAAANLPAEPNYRFPFKEFFTFDWGRIGARVVQGDEYGPSVIEWNGHANWTRRYAAAKGGRPASIWYSRAMAAEDADSGVQWYTLITFRDMATAEPMTGLTPPTQQTTRPPAPAAPPKTGDGNGKQTAGTPELFNYHYGDKVEATEKARPHFDAYRRANNEQAPASREALHQWCVQVGRV